MREPNGIARSGTIEIANVSDEPQRVKFVVGPRWKVPPDLELAPGEKKAVLLQLAPEDTGAVRETLKLTGAGIELPLVVDAPDVRGVLRAESPALSLQAAAGQPATGQVTVRNIGGHAGFWKIEADAPFALEAQELQLGPGEAKAAAVRLE